MVMSRMDADHRMTGAALLHDILEEFAAYRPAMESWWGYSIATRAALPGFDMEDPDAMRAEAAHLQAIEDTKRRDVTPVRPRPIQRSVLEARERRAKAMAERPACQCCGGPLPAPRLGKIPTYCGDACRKRAHYERTRPAPVAVVAPVPEEPRVVLCADGCGRPRIGLRKRCEECHVAWRRKLTAKCTREYKRRIAERKAAA